MSNPFHLVLQPEDGQSIRRILQSLTMAHTWLDHRHHKSVVHVRQGRFQRPILQGDEHLLTVLRYLEANPLRAGMVGDLANDPWSSYAVQGLGQPDLLLSEAPSWANLGATEAARQASWRKWVHERIRERELTAVRRSVTSGRPCGNETWVKHRGPEPGIALLPKRRGHPPKTRTEK